MFSNNFKAKSIRPFIASKNFQESRAFYRELGFEEIDISKDMCLFRVNEQLSFYLQGFYVKQWAENTMIFLEVDDVEKCAAELLAKCLTDKYEQVKFTEIRNEDWGREILMHDPAGVLWHFGQFNQT